MASRVDVIFDATTRGLDRGINKVQGGLGGLGRSALGTAAKVARLTAVTAAAGGAAFVAGKKILDMGETLEAMERRAETVFGAFVGEVRDFAEEMDAAFGLGRRELVGFTTSIGDLLVPAGFAKDEAAAMSIEFARLAGALSIATGEPIQRGFEAIESGIVGENEALRSLGIDIDKNLIKERLAAEGKDNLTGAALRQAEITALVAEVTAQSTDSQGAANEAMKEGDLQGRALNSALANAKATIVEHFNPGLEAAAGWLAELIERLLAGADNAGDFSDSVNDVASALTTMWELAKDVASAIGAIGRAANTVIGPLKALAANMPRGGDLGALQFAMGRKGGLLGLLGRGRQAGGPLGAGQAAIVGERGPELFVPGMAGTVVPNHRVGAGGPVVVINVAGSVMSEFDLVETVRRGLRTGAAEGRS